MAFATDCIHAGQEPEPVTGAVTYPIFQTSTYVQPSLGENKGYEYARTKNPTRSVLEANLAACSDIAHAGNVLVVVDNTFCSPYGQQPLELGADVVVHSTTKFLNGHSDSVGGAVILNDDELAAQIGFLQNAVGAILSPMDSWLILRGIKTLAVRMKQHEANGTAMASYLAHHPKVKKIYYPGLADHPQHALASRQMNGFGALISFDLGSYDNTKKFLDRVRLCSLGESLGGVETLISHPESMTHASVPLEERKRLGITPGLVRISVGIEDIEDLIADLENAFDGV